MKDPKSWINLALLVVVIALVFVRQLEKGKLEAEEVRADSLAAEMAVERARADGWVVLFAEETEHLGRIIEEKDSAYARLLQDYEASNITIHTYMELLTEAEGTIESLGTRADSLPLCESGEPRGSWEGSFDDGLLSAFWWFGLPEAALGMDYSAIIPGELIQGHAGDGRTVVNARGLHPRATLNIPAVYVDPLPPEQYCPWTTKAKYGGVVGGIGYLAGLSSCPCR